jgi:hypothetical protein
MEALVKSLFFCIVLISLCSCGGGSKEDNQNQAEQNQLVAEQFSLPIVNSYKSITIDSDVSTVYENMTINTKNEGYILGDNAFYVMINENAFPSYNEIRLSFYSHTKVNNVLYIDPKNISFPLSEINKGYLPMLKLKEVTDNFKDGLIWGKRNLDNPENDMLNKVYVIRTEEMQQRDNVEFKAESMYLIWFECKGNIKTINEVAYSCGKFNLKLHYKLLDYSLTSNKI